MEMDSTGRFGSKSGAVLYTVGLVEMMQFGTNVICNSRKISETNCPHLQEDTLVTVEKEPDVTDLNVIIP